MASSNRAVPVAERNSSGKGDDGWTLFSNDGSRGAQFEHTMIITRGEPIVVTANAQGL